MGRNLQIFENDIEKVNTTKFADRGSCTGGYDGMYGGGYSSSNTAVQIQNSETMGQEMLKIAEEDGMKLFQQEGYFIFGAGKTVKQGDASVQIPTSFVCSENKENNALDFSYKKSNDEDNAPFEISLKHKELEKKQLVCEFFKEREEQCIKAGMEYKETVVDGNPALITEKVQEDSLSRSKLSVLSKNGSEIYDLELNFKSNFENSRSIAERVYQNFKIKREETAKTEFTHKTEKGDNTFKPSDSHVYNEKAFEQKVRKKSFCLALPRDFCYEENIMGQKLVAYKKGCSIGAYNSPFEIYIEKIKLLKKQLICDFFSGQIKMALSLNAKYRELVVSTRPSLMFIEDNNSLPQTARISVLCTGGKGIYNIKIVFNKEFMNRDEIITKLYSEFKILE